jgi:hypothetical protein
VFNFLDFDKVAYTDLHPGNYVIIFSRGKRQEKKLLKIALDDIFKIPDYLLDRDSTFFALTWSVNLNNEKKETFYFNSIGCDS